jgi:multiple sugar transport system substrate-binding protein
MTDTQHRAGIGRRATLSLVALGAPLAAPRLARAQAPVAITVHYAQPFIFKESYDAIAAEFAKREPDIRIEWVTTPNYEEGMQLVLRQAATNQLPDLSYQGFNRLRLFAERGIAQDLMPLLSREGDPASLGYTPNLLALARFGGFQSGLAYAASNPICYSNADLVRRAGGDPDRMPTDWAGHIELSRRIKALGDGDRGHALPLGRRRLDVLRAAVRPRRPDADRGRARHRLRRPEGLASLR